MRRGRSWSRRFLVFALVAVVHVGLILLLVRGLASERHEEPAEDSSMTMILFAPTEERPSARVIVARHARHRPPTPSQPTRLAAPSAPPSPTSESSGKSIDWNLEMDRAADTVLQSPKTHVFGEHQKSGVDAPRPGPSGHYAGESYQDAFGDTYVWTSASCYVLSPAPELGVPTAFAHTRVTRFGCISQSPPEGELFKDLPEYKERHPP